MSGTLPAGERMKGKVCLVTGGGSGIGRATALRMASEGAEAVIVAGRRDAEIEAAAAACRELGSKACAVQTNITREDEVERLVRTAIERCGRLDVAFNNAGFQERRAPLEQQDMEIYDSVFDTNVRALFLCLRHQLPAMLRRGAAASSSMRPSAACAIRILASRSIPPRRRRRSR